MNRDTRGTRSSAERVSAADAVQLAVDVGPVPMQVGACLVLDGEVEAGELERLVAQRLLVIPRFRQRLVPSRVPWARPSWEDDPDLDVTRHVRRVRCPAPGDEQALLDLTAALVASPLHRSSPLWRVAVVTGLQPRRTAVVVVLHHVLADGAAALDVLGRLVDGPEPPAHSDPAPSSAAPTTTRWRDGWFQLWGSDGRRATRTSLNRPTGPRRRVFVVRAPLADVRSAAAACGATVNDALLVAVAGAAGRLLEARGEHSDQVVVSVPVAASGVRPGTLGNHVGAMRVAVPTTGDLEHRLRRTAAATRTAKAGGPAAAGASAALLGPAFRLLSALHLFRWFVEHQRLVTTFVSNVRGPGSPMRLAGLAVTDLLPVALTPGNVSAAFMALSYRGVLVVDVVLDPDLFPDHDVVVGALQDELDHMVLGRVPA